MPLELRQRVGLMSPLAGPVRLGFMTKDLLPEGLWTHPVHGYDIPVDEEAIDELAANTNALIAAGTDISVREGHRSGALANVGYARDFWKGLNSKGEWTLMGLVEFTEPEVEAKAKRESVKNVSVGLEPDYVDSKKAEFGPVVEHIALTNAPVIHGQDPFVPAPEVLFDRDGVDPFPRVVVEATADGGSSERRLLSRDGSSGIYECEISDAPWPDVDLGSLPASAYLIVEDANDPATWGLPVYEGAGPLKTVGDRKIHAARGALNRNAVRATAATLAGGLGDLSDDDRRTVARRLVGMYGLLGEESPLSLRRTAGILEGDLERFDAAAFLGVQVPDPSVDVWEDEQPKIVVESVGELIAKKDANDNFWDEFWALREYVEGIRDSSMSDEDKRKELRVALTEFGFIIAPKLAREIENVWCGPEEGPNSKGDETMPEWLKALLARAGSAALLARLKLTAPAEDVDEEGANTFVDSLLSRLEESETTLQTEVTTLRAAQPQPDPEPTEAARLARLQTLARDDPDVRAILEERRLDRETLTRLDRTDRLGIIDAARTAATQAMDTGRLNQAQADAYAGLLCVDTAQALALENDEPATAQADVAALARTLVDAIKDGAALDLGDRTSQVRGLAITPNPSLGTEVTLERAKELAKENVIIARGRVRSRTREA